MATCARAVTLTLTGASQTNTTQFDINLTITGNLVDVSGFGTANGYGDWLSCSKEGTLTVSSFDYLGTVDSITAYSIGVGSTTLSGNCIGTDFNLTATATGGDVAKFVYTLKLAD